MRPGRSLCWLVAVHRVLKHDRTFWFAIGDEHAAELRARRPADSVSLPEFGRFVLHFRGRLHDKLARSHAHLFYFVKDPKSFKFHSGQPENRVPSAQQLVYNDSRANPAGRLPDDTWIRAASDTNR